MSCVKRGVDIGSDFLCFFKETTDQKISKHKSAFTSTEAAKGEIDMEKNPNYNNIQRNSSLKSATTLDERQYPTESESLRILLHPANDKHDRAKSKNKQRTEVPNAAQKPTPEKLRAKDDI